MTTRRLLTWAWVVVILVACLAPAGLLPFHEHGGSASPDPHLDKIVHFALFLIFGLMWGGSRPLVGFGVGVVLTLVSEFAQGLPIVGRDPDFWDGLADVSGTLVGLAIPWFGTPGSDPAGEPETGLAAEGPDVKGP